jgi:hypothetical protein
MHSVDHFVVALSTNKWLSTLEPFMGFERLICGCGCGRGCGPDLYKLKRRLLTPPDVLPPHSLQLYIT